jgi:hypothetical protein
MTAHVFGRRPKMPYLIGRCCIGRAFEPGGEPLAAMDVVALPVRGELARSQIFDHTLTQRTDRVSLVHGELHPGEVDDTSMLRTGRSNGYWGPLDWLLISRLLLPRSGLERSDLVPWPKAAG